MSIKSLRVIFMLVYTEYATSSDNSIVIGHLHRWQCFMIDFFVILLLFFFTGFYKAVMLCVSRQNRIIINLLWRIVSIVELCGETLFAFREVISSANNLNFFRVFLNNLKISACWVWRKFPFLFFALYFFNLFNSLFIFYFEDPDYGGNFRSEPKGSFEISTAVPIQKLNQDRPKVNPTLKNSSRHSYYCNRV